MDIVARLKLEASQFSSEGGRAIADFTGKLDKAGRELRQSFSANMAEVQKLAQTALIVPRTEGGALNLGPEITALNSRAVAFEQNAIAARELQQALLATAAAGKGDTEALLREADAAMLAARAHDLEADALRERADVLGHVQSNLARTTTATIDHTDATKGATGNANAMRFAMQGLSYQAQDTFTQLSMGANVFQVLAIQGGQAAGAFANVEGKAGAVARVLIGPWGLAATAALLAFGPLVSKLWESSTAAAESAKRLTQAATAADSFGNAQSLLGKVIDLTTGKMKTQNEVLIQMIRLQAQVGILNAQKEAKKNTEALAKLGAPGATGLGALYGGFGEVEAGAAEAQRAAAATAPLRQVLADFATIANNPNASPKTFATAVDDAVKAVDKLAASGSVAKKNVTDVKLALLALATNRQDQIANQQVLDVLNGGPIPGDLKPYHKDPKPKKGPKPKDYTQADNSAAVQLAEMNAQWERAPTLIEKANIATLKLDNLYGVLSKRKLTPEVEQLLATITKVRDRIREGMDEPYRQFIETQQQGLLVQRLILDGRTAEATALQAAIRLTQQMGPLDERRLATVLQLATKQEAISIALEDQRRIIGMYVGTVGEMQQSFNAFLNDLQTRPASAIGNLASSLVADFNHLQTSILSEQIFGGLNRDIEKYVREVTGRKTPAEILQDQAKGAGVALKEAVSDSGLALGDFAKMVRSATASLSPSAANDNGMSPPQLIEALKRGNAVTSSVPVAYADEVTVTGRRLADTAAQKMLSAANLFDYAGGRIAESAGKLLGLPPQLTKALGDNLGKVLQGASFGQLGGSVFSSISGSKDNKLASGIGGILGDKLGSKLGDTIGKSATGLLKTLGGAAGPLGAIAGGVLGSLVGGLFNKPNWSNASISLNQWGDVSGGQGAGKGGDAIQAATGVASSVSSGINTIADQLGATIKGLPALTLGTWNDKYRVALTATTKPLHSNNFGPDVLKDFGGDQQAAIEYAVRYSISHAVVTGISKASQNILASGQDLQSAINKALLIESVPKSLKEYYDPVGAAIDALNMKFQHIKDAMEEGGATAEQLAQAEQLYNLQLAQTKNSTTSATQTLKDFQKSLMLGSNSPYSLRDQESTAFAALKPFLEQIGAGQAIDQSKYQEAAQSYLDVERQMYGSTSKYFEVLDTVQAATNKAIAAFDNIAPIGTPVESPFAKATAASAAQTAANTQATAEIGAQTNDLLQRLVDVMNARIANDIGYSSDRGFVLKTG